MATIKEVEDKLQSEISKDEVETHFLVPINDLLLGVKLVEKDNRKVKKPYVSIELLIPHDIAMSVPSFLKSEWKLALLGLKIKNK